MIENFAKGIAESKYHEMMSKTRKGPFWHDMCEIESDRTLAEI